MVVAVEGRWDAEAVGEEEVELCEGSGDWALKGEGSSSRLSGAAAERKRWRDGHG